ncbi:putative cofD-like protein [Neomicrococcus lactis]|uniref:Putative gluconeogenesis factor n=2 Tax=Neomicrococcus lactis TaxID=732241 RepID=A0A7W8YAB2_9MICC|nr:putative cofD-like protein [Neomicrococcus lactis]
MTGMMPLVPLPTPRGDSDPLKVVALGGGHGLSASLKALRRLTSELTAVVTVADDGGSSGRIREELDVLPPGDLRMALSALCDDTDWGRTWRDVMQHRFKSKPGSEGSLDGHAMGNLLITALWELLGDPVQGLRWAGALLGARGQVLPMSVEPLAISGVIMGDAGNGQLKQTRVTGQAQLAKAGNQGTVTDVNLIPADAPACQEAVNEIMNADWCVVGPGSWYTSVMPHILLPGIREALQNTNARILVTMNLTTDTKETVGMDAAGHLQTIHRYAPDLRVDAVLADNSAVEDVDAFEKAAEGICARVFFDRVGVGLGSAIHDPLRLTAAYHNVFTAFV